MRHFPKLFLCGGWRKHLAIPGLLLLTCGVCPSISIAAQPSRRAVVAEDSILYEEPIPNGPLNDQYFNCSHDRSLCGIVSRHGDIKSDSMDYTLWVIELKNGKIRSIHHRSFSNEQAISLVQWQGQTMYFLYRDNANRGIVASWSPLDGQERDVTPKYLDISGFRVVGNGNIVAGLAARDQFLFTNPKDRHVGLDVKQYGLGALLTEKQDTDGFFAPVTKIYVKSGSRERVLDIPTPMELSAVRAGTFSMSSDGDFVALVESPTPAELGGAAMQEYGVPRGWAVLPRLRLLDIRGPQPVTVSTFAVPAAAVSSAAVFGWLNDRALVVSALMPRASQESPEHANRARQALLIYDIDSRAVSEIRPGSYEIQADGKDSLLARRVSYFDDIWPINKRLAAEIAIDHDGNTHSLTYVEGHECNLRLIQGRNTPPTVEKKCPGNKRVTILDFNPRIGELELAHVDEFTYTDTKGNPRTCGLFVPPHARPGERLPLVIQTHGWSPDRFSFTGALGKGYDSQAGYAAQALAAHGYYVAQCDTFSIDATEYSGESSRAAQNIDAVVSTLNAMGIADLDRLGLVGWSRSGIDVLGALTRSKFRFKAALLADAETSSYGEYLAVQNLRNGQPQLDLEHMNNASPIGRDGLRSWANRADIYGVAKPNAAIKMMAFGSLSLLTMWEAYVSLNHVGINVSLSYFPDAAHNPIRPLERLSTQRNSIEWFDRWLNDARIRSAIK